MACAGALRAGPIRSTPPRVADKALFMGRERDPMDMTTQRGDERRERATQTSLGLTIAYHPELARIGEVAALGRGTTLVSRSAPAFGRRGGASATLASPFISRRPFRVEVTRDVRVVPGDGDDVFRVDGEAIAAPTVIATRGTAPNVVIEAGGLVFVLHAVLDGELPPELGMVGESVPLQRVRRQILRAAPHDIPVLVRGESGVGKELVARALHAHSLRAARPFVSVNMAAIPPAMAASALFGHRKGAFTGADRDHRGYFGEADGGTLFMDEVGAAPAELQPALLRALEAGEIQPVGAHRPQGVDVRLVAATDLALESAVDEGQFRLPLLMRLSGYEITVPPLRARRDDIPRLFLAFLREELERVGAPSHLTAPLAGGAAWLTREAMLVALTAPWAGNVRQLRHAVRQLVVDNADEPHTRHLDGLRRHAGNAEAAAPEAASEPVPSSRGTQGRAGAPLDDISSDALRAALEAARFRPLAAARALGISKTSIYELMRRYGVPTSNDIDAATLVAALERARGDVSEAARALSVTPRALKLRMRTLGLA